MWKRIKKLGLPLLWLSLIVVLALTWTPQVQPSALLATTEGATPWLLSPDNRWLLASQDNHDIVIGVPEGPRLVFDRHHLGMWSESTRCEFSRDSKFFVGRKDRDVCIWSLETGEEQKTLGGAAEGIDPAVGFSLDSEKVAVVAGHRPLEIHDVHPRVPALTIPMTTLFRHPYASWIVRWSWGDGQTFLAEEHRGNLVVCWDVRKTRVRFQIDNLVDSYGVARPTWRVSPDGRRCIAIVSAERPKDNNLAPKTPIVQAWDITTGKKLWQRPFAPQHVMFDLSFSPDGQQIAICSRDLSRQHLVELQLWNVEDGNVQTIAETNGQETFLFTPTGRFFQHAHGWWELHDAEARSAIRFDDDSQWHDRAGNTHSPYTQEEIAGEKQGMFAARQACMARVGGEGYIGVQGVMANLSPDDRQLALRLTFDYQKGKWSDWLSKINFFRANLIRTGRDYELHLIDVDDGSRMPIIHDAEYWLFSHDGKFLITKGPSDLRVWTLPLSTATWHRWVLGGLIGVLLLVHGWIWRKARKQNISTKS